MALFEKIESYVGVDIGAGGIKLVELKKTKGRPQLWTYGIASEDMGIHVGAIDTSVEENLLPPVRQKEQPMTSSIGGGEMDERIERYGSLLKTLVSEAKVSTRRATASLPVSQVFHTMVTLPTVDQKEIDYHIKAKIKKMLPQPIDDMQVVHQVIEEKQEGKEKKKPEYLRVLVTAAPKQLVGFYSAIFEKAGLQLEELETEAFALERSLVGHNETTVMIIDIGAERTNFFIVDRGLPLTHRSIQVGGTSFDAVLEGLLELDQQMVSQIKKDLSHMSRDDIRQDIFFSTMAPIIKEIAYSFDLFLHQTGNEQKRPEKIILTGGAALFPPIETYIRQKFPVKVFVGDPWARVVYQQGLKQVLDAVGPRMGVAIGLAMRNIV